MKNCFLVFVVTLSMLFNCKVCSSMEVEELLNEYYENKIGELSSRSNVGIYEFIVTMLPDDCFYLQEILSGYKKRFSEKKIVEKLRAKKKVIEEDNKIKMFVEVKVVGDLKGSIEFQDDFADFIFLENDYGKFTRCVSVEFIATKVKIIDNETYNPKILNKNTNTKLLLGFDRFDDDGEDIVKGTPFLHVCFERPFGDMVKIKCENYLLENQFGDAPFQYDNMLDEIVDSK